MNTVLTELAKLHATVVFAKVEAEAVPELSLKYAITAVPAFVFLQVSISMCVCDRREHLHQLRMYLFPPYRMVSLKRCLRAPMPPSLPLPWHGWRSSRLRLLRLPQSRALLLLLLLLLHPASWALSSKRGCARLWRLHRSCSS
jgi:hypothetical protein